MVVAINVPLKVPSRPLVREFDLGRSNVRCGRFTPAAAVKDGDAAIRMMLLIGDPGREQNQIQVGSKDQSVQALDFQVLRNRIQRKQVVNADAPSTAVLSLHFPSEDKLPFDWRMYLKCLMVCGFHDVILRK